MTQNPLPVLHKFIFYFQSFIYWVHDRAKGYFCDTLRDSSLSNSLQSPRELFKSINPFQRSHHTGNAPFMHDQLNRPIRLQKPHHQEAMNRRNAEEQAINLFEKNKRDMSDDYWSVFKTDPNSEDFLTSSIVGYRPPIDKISSSYDSPMNSRPPNSPCKKSYVENIDKLFPIKSLKKRKQDKQVQNCTVSRSAESTFNNMLEKPDLQSFSNYTAGKADNAKDVLKIEKKTKKTSEFSFQMDKTVIRLDEKLKMALQSQSKYEPPIQKKRKTIPSPTTFNPVFVVCEKGYYEVVYSNNSIVSAQNNSKKHMSRSVYEKKFEKRIGHRINQYVVKKKEALSAPIILEQQENQQIETRTESLNLYFIGLDNENVRNQKQEKNLEMNDQKELEHRNKDNTKKLEKKFSSSQSSDTDLLKKVMISHSDSLKSNEEKMNQ